MTDIEFLKLTTEICFIIGGYYSGRIDRNVYRFVNDSGWAVWIDLDIKKIIRQDRLTRLQELALDKLAKDHGFGIGQFRMIER